MKLLFSVILFAYGLSVQAQDKLLILSNIKIEGNKKTHENIILRELTFKSGRQILSSDLDKEILRSRENLLNTSLFNYVTIGVSDNYADSVSIIIKVEERWYLWPRATLQYEDRNFAAWLKAGDLSKSKYGFAIEKFNSRGRKETMKVSFLFGYARQFEFSYKNVAIDRDRKHFIGAEIQVSSQDEMIFNTLYDEPVTYKSKFNSVFEKRKFTLNYTFRPMLYSRHNVFLNYFKYNVSDTIINLNPDFFGKLSKQLEFLTLDYVYTNDKRDSKAYPLKGSYFDILIGQTVSLKTMGSRVISSYIIPNYYRYIEINDRFHYAANICIKLSYTNLNSYYFSRSLGYIYNLHGFEYNTIEGQQFIIFRNLIKATILKPRISEISFIPFRKFNKIHYALYFNLFADCGYVSDKYQNDFNRYSNRFLSSTGAGLDLATYYDRTLSVSYSYNGFGKGGIYLSLTAPINK